MGLFGRPTESGPVQPSPANHFADQTPVRTGSPGASRETDSLAQALLAGQQLRLAVEAGDEHAAQRAWSERQTAKARAAGYPAGDGFLQFDSRGMSAAFTQPEFEALGLPPDREHDLRLGIALSSATGTEIGSTDAAAAALLGVDLTRLWPAFVEERAHWARVGHLPAMWTARLLEPPLSEDLPTVITLSLDARHVLALPKLIRRRQLSTRQTLLKRTLLTEPRLEAALTELAAAGLSSPVTLADRLATLTVADLKEALGQLGLPTAGAKPALVSALAEAAESMSDESAISSLLAGANEVEEGAITVGLGIGKQADYLMDYASLLGQWAIVGVLGRAGEAARPGPSGWTVLKTDDCPLCKVGPDRVARSYPEQLPPFHLGCRCCGTPD